jgi:predicted dehydrogenase
MTVANIKAAVVGVGFIGVAHVEALRRLGVDVVGVVGSDAGRAGRKAASASLPRVYDDLDALLADPAIDVVHIATPNHLHAPQVRDVLAAGKHVVCEKPLALTADDAADLVSLADAAGKVHAVCFNLRFYPLLHQARLMVATGEIGAPRFITGHYLQDWLLLETDWNWRLVPHEAGALRSVADIGSHWLDLARFISGQRIVEVMADLHTFVPIRRHPAGPVETFATVDAGQELIEEAMTSDDGAGALLRFEDGARGTVSISQVAAGRKNSISIEVDGSKAALAWTSEDSDRMWIGHRGRSNELLHRDPSLVSPEVRRIIGYPGGHMEGYPDTFRALFSQVYEDIARGGPSPEPAYPTFRDGLDALAVTEAFALSSATRQWVAVER